MTTLAIMIITGIMATVYIQKRLNKNKIVRENIKDNIQNKDFIKSLKINDYVLTLGGIYGYVKDIKEKKVLLEIAQNTTITMDINAIIMRLKQEE